MELDPHACCARGDAGHSADFVSRPARHLEGRQRVDRQRQRKPASSGTIAERAATDQRPIHIDDPKQDGRRFSGTFSSPRDAEPIIGVLTRAGNLLFVDTDGYASGTLLGPDRLEACYLQIATYGRVASCTELTRQP